jgi:hypothetical protein
VPDAPVTIRVVASFSDAASARHGETALLAAGIAPSSIVVAGAGPVAPAPPPEREEHFLGRLVLIVVLWSVVGTFVGVIMGLIFNAAGIGPEGGAGIGIQVASWAIFAHLIAGMWAGYALLTRGESREPATRIPGGRAVVSVHAQAGDEQARVTSILRSAGATAVSAYDGAGERIVNTTHVIDGEQSS